MNPNHLLLFYVRGSRGNMELPLELEKLKEMISFIAQRFT